MKRDKFVVALNGGEVKVKYSWNAALGFIRSHIKDVMIGNTASEHVSSTEKDKYNRHVKGTFHWIDDKFNDYTYTITKITDY